MIRALMNWDRFEIQTPLDYWLIFILIFGIILTIVFALGWESGLEKIKQVNRR